MKTSRRPGAVRAAVAAVLAVGAVAACAHRQPVPEVRNGASPAEMRMRRIMGADTQEVRVRSVPLDSVTLSVPWDAPAEGPGECGEPVKIGAQRVLRLRWAAGDGRARRSVAVTLDSAGEVVAYSDGRGSAMYRQPPDPSAPGTTIALGFERRSALVMNRGGAGPENYVVPFPDALRSPLLDRPRDRIREILRRCRGEAGN